MEKQKLLESVRHDIEADISLAENRMTEFSKALVENPAYAFTWSSDAFVATGRWQVAQIVLSSFLNREDRDPLESLDAAIRFARKELVRRAESPEHSTSPQSNLVFEAVTSAWANFVRKYDERSED